MDFSIPASLPVVAGNGGNKKARLTIELANGTIDCEYRSRSSQVHPTTAAQLALASSYALTGCEVVGEDGHDDDDDDDDDDRRHLSSLSYGAGSIVKAINVRLHIQNGDTRQPMTKIRVVLAEVCATSSVSSHLEASGPIDGGPQTAGCSSSGASLTPFLVAFAFLALLLRRPAAQASIRLVTRQEPRRLPR